MRFVLGASISALISLFLFQACGNNCITHEKTVCAEGVIYWIDSCGNREEVAETCDCGCNTDYSGCETPCTCTPQCSSKCCGDNGCGDQCPNECPIGYECNMSTCVCDLDTNPCEGVDCDGHGTCREYQGEAYCECENGYRISVDGLHCELIGYNIQLNWSYPDAANCTAAGVSGVDVLLLQGTTEIVQAMINCLEGDGAEIIEVQDGSYKIELRADNSSGEMLYYVEGVTTVNGRDQTLNMIFDPVGFLAFTWDMEGMTCTAGGVDQVRVIVNSEDGSTNIYSANPVPSCDEGGHRTKDTAFFFLDNYNLVLEGVCQANMTVGYRYDAIMMVTEKGENNYGLLTLDRLRTGCQ